MPIATYAASAARRSVLLFLAAATLLSAAAGAYILFSRVRGGEGIIFAAIFAAIGLFRACYIGVALVCLVELTATELRWQYPLYTRAAPLSDLRSFRCTKTQSRQGKTTERATVEFASRKPLKFPVYRPGMAEFLARVQELAPSATVVPPSAEEPSA